MLHYCSLYRVASIFFAEPTRRHSLPEIVRSIGLAHTSVKRHLQTLEQAGLITRETEERGSRRFIYYHGADSDVFRREKRTANLRMVQPLVRHVADTLQPDVIVLFGSYARGEDVEKSDIDIYVQCGPQPLRLSQYEQELGRKIELHFRKDFASLPEELKNNILNGVVMHGYLRGFS